MSSQLNGAKVAFLVAHEGVEQVELTEPWKAVQEAGGTPVLLSPDAGSVQAFNHLDKADTFQVDQRVSEADLADFAALVLPGQVVRLKLVVRKVIDLRFVFCRVINVFVVSLPVSEQMI